ncbi:MAG: TetR/AcrR family transcriptional regulator [Gemmatimonadota bacterium]
MRTTAAHQRSGRTRAHILETAETIFAAKGYAATRLEDIAAQVGIRRASLVYYFRDKQELYDAVLTDVIGGLMTRVQHVITAARDLPDAVDAALDAWVDYAGERPALARLLLREIADAQPGKPSLFVQHAMPVLGLMQQAIREGQRLELFLPIDPIHFASTITGATVFFLVGTPLLGDAWPLNPRSADQLAHLKEELRRVARRLLGFVGPKTRARSKNKK